VTLDQAIIVELLGCSEIVLFGVHEKTSLHAGNSKLNGECSVGLNGITVLGENEFAGRHVGDGRDDTHRRRVARSRGDLLAVGDREVWNSEAEVDEIVARCE